MKLHVRQGYTGMIKITTNFVQTLFGITSGTKRQSISFATEWETIYNRHTVISLCTGTTSCMSNLKFLLKQGVQINISFPAGKPNVT